ncbi:MAG: AbrB/MazE/SpoVT family DNA-binding domain-containing protein [Pyrinomonadaceae bacterium]
MQSNAKITSKGQITIPLKVRKALGVKEGDRLVFEQDNGQMVVRPEKRESRLAKYAGIGNPGIGKGRQAVIDYVRSLRDTE